MEKSEIELLFKEYFENLSRYSELSNYFRGIHTLATVYNKLKTTGAGHYLDFYEEQKDTKLLDEKYSWDYMLKIVDVFRQTEIEIAEEESGLNFKYPTFAFNKEAIFNYTDKLKSKAKKLNYLNYIKKEYPEHLLRRRRTITKNTIKLQKDIAIESIIFRFLAQSYTNNKKDFERILAPIMERTLPELLEAEIAYYNGYIEEIPTENVNPEIDINELLMQISDSKSIDINDPHQLMKVIGKYLKMDFDLENTPILEKITKQTKNSEKIKKEVKYYTIKEVCELLKIGRSQLYYLRLNGVLSYVQHGRQVRIPKSEVDEYISENTVRL
ncbi:MAG: helix-turn-helix domain-containing protein [bacterium]